MQYIELRLIFQDPAGSFKPRLRTAMQHDRIRVLITTERCAIRDQSADSLQPNHLLVERTGAIQIADVQFYISQFSVSDHCALTPI